MTTVVDEEAVVVTATHDYSLDIIGTLYDPGVGYDPETETWETPPVAKSGYHANLRWLSGASVPAALSGVTISAPDTPDRG